MCASIMSGRVKPLRRHLATVKCLTFAVLSLYILGTFRYGEKHVMKQNVESAIEQRVPSPDSLPWLIATISETSHLQRRQIIRSSWQRLFRNERVFETRFVLGKPDALWAPYIQHENETYGDLIVLDHEHEDHIWANTLKTIELFKYLSVEDENSKWTFVSKMDEDSWIDAKNFWKLWLLPRIDEDNISGTYIGRPIKHWAPWTYATGGFYTLSFDMIELLVSLHDENPIQEEHEDILIARLLVEGGIEYNVTELPHGTAFDYWYGVNRGDGSAWAPFDQDLAKPDHGIAPGALSPHGMKDDLNYLQVAACYDENGLILDDYFAFGREVPTMDDGWDSDFAEP